MTTKRRFVLSLVAASVLAGLAVAVQIPETVTIDKAQKKQAPVVLTHKAHAEKYACSTCHHNHENLKADSSIQVVPCFKCHLDPEKPETLSMREMSLGKNPFHKLCIDCHKKEAKGPVKCAECHKK